MKMRKAVIPTSLLFLAPLMTFACWQNLSAQTAEHPGHHAANQAADQDQSAPAAGKMPPGMNMPMDMPGMNPGMPGMPGMNNGDADKSLDNHAESGAMHAMQPGHHMDGAHMRMTPMRPATSDDLARADQIATALRQSIEPYRDYRVALAEGYKIFMPNLPQAVYHFTNYWNGFLEGFTFDPARPTSLLYKKTKDGYELVGAMYTAPRSATLEQLDERVPLGIASWHVHTNLCVPRQGQAAHADWTKFGLTGSISTPEACSEAGGRFYPQIFGWMVHVYPFEASRAKVWGQ